MKHIVVKGIAYEEALALWTEGSVVVILMPLSWDKIGEATIDHKVIRVREDHYPNSPHPGYHEVSHDFHLHSFS